MDWKTKLSAAEYRVLRVSGLLRLLVHDYSSILP
jgi:hypothetical protein